MVRRRVLVLVVLVAVTVCGCPKSPKATTEYQKGLAAQAHGNTDDALEYFQNALKSDPSNAEYKITLDQARFEVSEKHVGEGVQLREKGKLEDAMHQFQMALTQDSSNPIAAQELESVRAQLAAVLPDGTQHNAEAKRKTPPLASLPPELKPLSSSAVNLRMTNDAKVIFDTIGKLSGLSMIFDPDFPAHRISVELNDVTLEQALDIACLESKAFWKPVTENIVMVIPDQTQKRRDFDEQIMRTFYLSNTVQPQELTEIVTGLRQLLDLKRIQQLNGQNAIVMRDTPAKIALAEKFINDVDKAKPEVVIQVQVLQASTNRLRTLGILPGQSASIQINPYNCANTSSGCSSSSSSSSSNNTVTLNNLKHLNSSDYTVTLPSLTANAVLTDSDTRIIQSPEVRIVDGMIAKLKVGDRVPVATGSYSAGTSVNSSANLNSLISTQFQYIDVGVNLDITPRVHPNGEVSLKIAVEVSSVTNYVTIGGIQQPVISQRKIEHDIRLKEGETNILGGLFQRTDTKSLNGWPGLAKIPMMRYLFSSDSKDSQENDVLIVLTPHIIRNPEWTDDNLKPVSTGSETNIAVHREHALSAPSQTTLAGATSTAEGSSLNQTPGPEPSAHLKVAPSSAEMKVGETQTFSIAVDRVTDLFSIPLLIKYDSNVIHIEDVQNGGFLSGETQEIAIVQRNDAERGEMMVSAVRQPHTPGVGGSGVVFTLVVKAIGAGTSQIAVVQVNAKNSNQKTILLATHDASIHARP